VFFLSFSDIIMASSVFEGCAVNQSFVDSEFRSAGNLSQHEVYKLDKNSLQLVSEMCALLMCQSADAYLQDFLLMRIDADPFH